MNNCLVSVFALMLTMLFVSCSGSVPPMQRDYADAVTCLNQVDPYYRAFFRAQNGSNYTLSDQRKAYLAAIQTARTPVRASEYRNVPETRLASRSSKAKRGKGISSRRAVARRGKGASSRRAIAKRGSKASRRSARRGARRRG